MLARSAAMVSGVVKLRPESCFMPWTERNSPASCRLSNSARMSRYERLAHAAPESVAEDRPLVGHGLALEDAVASEGDGLFRVRSSAPVAAPAARARSRAAATTCCG